jgi:hypothetical protein
MQDQPPTQPQTQASPPAAPAVSPEPPAPDPIESAILDLAASRGHAASFCPSEVARALHTDWRPYMGRVRIAAIRLMQAGRIEILRKGRPVGADGVRGVIRLRAVDPAP